MNHSYNSGDRMWHCESCIAIDSLDKVLRGERTDASNGHAVIMVQPLNV